MAKLIDITGKAISGEWGTDDETGDGIPVLRTTNFTNDGVINFENVVTRTIKKNNIESKYLQNGDIILEKSGGSDKQPVGRVVYFEGAEHKYLFNNFTGLLRVQDESKWVPKYVFYALFASYRQGKTRNYENKTTGLHNLQTESFVKQTDVRDNTIECQKEECAILDNLRHQVLIRKKELEQFDTLIKARFVELFGDPINNPMNWDTDSVEALCDNIYGGGTPSKSHPEYYENGNIPWVSSKDMKTDIICDSQIHINQLGVDNSTAQMVPVNSMIMVIRSGILKHTLPVAVNAVPVTVNQDLKVFIPSERLLTKFMAVQFKILEKDILSGVRAVTADNIEFNSLKRRKLIVPPIEKQRRYVDFISHVNKSKFDEAL